MTNSAASQWEVAGAKKLSQRTNDLTKTAQQKIGLNKKASLPSKIPVIETLKPLKLENGIYDYLAPESDDEDEVKKVKAKKSPKSEKNAEKSAPVSPKKSKNELEPVNLLKANIDNKQKRKSAPLSPGKQTKTELETAIAELSLDAFQKKQTQLESLFPDNQTLCLMHMAAFLNQSLNDIPDTEPHSMHENESNMYPANKLDKKLEKFLNNLVAKLKKPDAESVFDYCLNEIVKNDNPKVVSNHGLRIFIQLLLKHNQSILIANLAKYSELINVNRHRHQRVLLALWALSHAGYLNLTNGITIWFETMLPLIGVKHFSVYISTYLYALFKHHKIDSKSIVANLSNQYIINLHQYLQMYELINENTIQNKEAFQRLRSSFEVVRALFLANLEFSEETGNVFAMVLANLTNSDLSQVKQTEYLEILARCLFSNTDAMKVWREVFLKNVKQSTLFIEYLTINYNKKFKTLPNMRETLVKFKFDSESVLVVAAAVSPAKEDSKKPYYINKKANKSVNNTVELEKFNKLVKTVLKQNFKRTSFFSVMFRVFFTFAFLTGAFFYWDQTQNKSIYLKAGQRQLAKYGLLDETTRLVEATKKSLLDAQKLANHHVPIWYKKTTDTVLPYTKKAWDVSVEYSHYAWENTESLRNSANVYYRQINKYVQENWPVVKKALKTYFELANKYAVKGTEEVRLYTNKGIQYIGTQLLGWKEGELEKIFLDAYKVANDSVFVGINWVKKSLKNLTAQ